mmetsp:Transcript_22166/g.59788  ORF Transcript_22166/g.59788 Transcript_22166/m.59788 type:complete len:265 (+) Transcript_22166:447-1241(+)
MEIKSSTDSSRGGRRTVAISSMSEAKVHALARATASSDLGRASAEALDRSPSQRTVHAATRAAARLTSTLARRRRCATPSTPASKNLAREAAGPVAATPSGSVMSASAAASSDSSMDAARASRACPRATKSGSWRTSPACVCVPAWVRLCASRLTATYVRERTARPTSLQARAGSGPGRVKRHQSWEGSQSACSRSERCTSRPLTRLRKSACAVSSVSPPVASTRRRLNAGCASPDVKWFTTSGMRRAASRRDVTTSACKSSRA